MSFEAVLDDKEVRSFISDISNRVSEAKEGRKQFVGLLSSIVFRDVTTHFEQEKGSQGTWKPWSAIYRKHLSSIGRAGNKILQFNGRLRQNFMPTDFKTSSAGITWFNNAVTKSGYPYAWGHNEGDGKLPKRDFMWLSDSALEDISAQTLQYMIQEGV